MGDREVKERALQIVSQSTLLPRLVVFDLDHTLWPLYCDCCSRWDTPYLYPHVRGILQALKDKGVDMAIASRSDTPDIAEAFLDKLGLQSMFVVKEIYPTWTHKTEHFQQIHTKTQVSFKSMLFFDDEFRNINAVSKMGVTTVYVSGGVNLDQLKLGLATFSKDHP